MPTVRHFGVSETGPAHRADGLPNQDKWLHAKGRYGRLIVVCDGLGSRSHSGTGSKHACLAARDAVRYWSANPHNTHDRLGPLIHALWRARIAPHPPEDCATTCLLALRQPTGAWLIGGIGDGLAATRGVEGELAYIVGGARDGFLNETAALGMAKSNASWRFVVYPENPNSRTAIIATDGISDDLVPERTDAFVAWLIAEHGDLLPGQRTARLRSLLRNWPSKKHSDDKTLAVMWEVPGEGGQ
jgi:serine/threonine protein phosphatase PrpC